MKKILKVVGVILLLLVVVFLVAGLIIKKDYHLEREITINAPKEKVWNNVNSLQSLEKWSPWVGIDPNMKTSFEGAPGTVGSVYKWEGNSDVGQGSQTLTAVQSPDAVTTHLHFIKPFEGEADATVKLAEANGATKVTWTFDSRYKYPMNVMTLFMDGMMGDQYNKGLSKLKQISEH